MRILIDTNVAITYVSGREDRYAGEIERIMRLCAEEKVEGVIAFHSLSTIWYVTRQLPEAVRREWIKQLCVLLTISGADNEAVISAVDNTAFRDFEDALQDCCAAQTDADYIVTANVRDFIDHSSVRAITPSEFLKLAERLEGETWRP